MIGGGCRLWSSAPTDPHKVPSLASMRHVARNAEHCCRPPWWCGDPHPGQVPVNGCCCLVGRFLRTAWKAVWPMQALVISARCCLAASCALHLDTVFAGSSLLL